MSITSAQMIVEVECTRQSLIKSINNTFDHIIARLESEQHNLNSDELQSLLAQCTEQVPSSSEYIVPLNLSPRFFVGKKPIALIIEDERVSVKSWREVLGMILKRCCQDPTYHNRLMELRGRVAGNFRIFLSSSPNGMSKAVQIDDELYIEAHHGAEAMMRMLVEKLLTPIGYDYSNIKIGLLPKGGGTNG